MPLHIAAKIDDVDREYFEREIEPLLDQEHVSFIGEIGPEEKNEFLGHAHALLFPIDWSEPFGLVMIESMACATPVVAYRSGSVPEVIADGVSGFIVEDIDGAVDAVGRLHTLDRAAVRADFERRFSVERMARDYLAVYERLVSDGGKPRPAALSIGEGARTGV
jgi:glycosyltransferase involved in cell wall biosynthesis